MTALDKIRTTLSEYHDDGGWIRLDLYEKWYEMFITTLIGTWEEPEEIFENYYEELLRTIKKDKELKKK
jgi:hypothetical protein